MNEEFDYDIYFSPKKIELDDDDIYFDPGKNKGILGTYDFLNRWDSNYQSGLIRGIAEEIDKHKTGPMTPEAEYIRKFTGKDPRMPEYTFGIPRKNLF